MARNAHDRKSDFVFRARGPKGHMVRFDSGSLDVHANGLRHTYSCVDASLGIGELNLDMLTTHKPKGMTQKYFVQMIVNSGPAMRTAQKRMSAEIVKRLATRHQAAAFLYAQIR
jgi:hypothetical protein